MKKDVSLDITVDDVNAYLKDYLENEVGSYEGVARKKHAVAMVNAMLYQTSVMKRLDKSNTVLTIVLSVLGLIVTIAGIIIPLLQ